ncbi:MAG: hypothetical protein IJ060_12305 [Oscillospiraceae bacterium]|nr:hypothetical protein [Oscillospiraceae bacterium]
MNVTCICFHEDHTVSILQDCVRFSLLRDRYQPFSALNVQLHTETALKRTVRVQFFLSHVLLHDGLVREASCSREEGQYLAAIQSRGFSSFLLKNQLVPGIHPNVTLNSLMETYQLPNVTYQENMQAISYLYVKDNTSMWDSLIAYNYKLNGGFPYIRVPNLVCVVPQTGTRTFSVPQDAVIETGTGIRTADILSRIDMADAAGEYGCFTRTNALAGQLGIVRVRQILFDRQFSHAPQDALQMRLSLSNRRYHSRTVTYAGYLGEDLEDSVAAEGVTARVSRIDIRGDAGGVITADTFYDDDFCNAG